MNLTAFVFDEHDRHTGAAQHFQTHTSTKRQRVSLDDAQYSLTRGCFVLVSRAGDHKSKRPGTIQIVRDKTSINASS